MIKPVNILFPFRILIVGFYFISVLSVLSVLSVFSVEKNLGSFALQALKACAFPDRVSPDRRRIAPDN